MSHSAHLPHNANGDVQFIPPPHLTRWPPVEQWTEVEWACWLGQHGWTPEQIAQYLDHDRFVYGVGFTPSGEKAGPHNAYDAGVTWLFKPTPRGVTLHETRLYGPPNTLWGGSVGGTKSMSARWEAISECLFTSRDDYRALIVRRELTELERTHLDKIKNEARKLNAVLGKNSVEVTAKLATFNTTGARIVFGHAKDDGDEEKYLSEDYDLFIADEATRLLWSQIAGIQARVRNDTKINRVGRMILTTNPGGPAHDDCVRYFITQDVRPDENEKYDASDYRFIRSRLFDNPHYMDSDGTYNTYIKRLYLYTPARRQQLLDGDWDAIVGQFFTDFSPSTHVRAA